MHMGVICCFNICALTLHVHPYINDLELTFSNTERMAWCHKNTGILVLEFQGEVWYGMYQTINGVFLRGRKAFKGKRNVHITTSLSVFSLGALFGNTLAIKTSQRVGHNWVTFIWQLKILFLFKNLGPQKCSFHRSALFILEMCFCLGLFSLIAEQV